MDIINSILEYEMGELSTEDTVKLFSELVANGMAWSLQGAYGRMAKGMIDSGVLDTQGTIDWDTLADLIDRQ